MKKIFFLFLSSLFLAASYGGRLEAASKVYKVGVTVIVSHPALEEDQRGFEQALKDAGLSVKYDYQNAQGEMSNAQTIAQKFRDERVDLVHAIATPTSQAAVKVIKDIPIVYSSVTDPVDAGLVKTMGPDGRNVTGVSDAWPIYMQIKLYHEMLPSAHKWGTIYNAGDANSLVNIGKTKKAMAELGLKLVEVTVSNSNEVYTAAQSLVGRVDAIYITSDNTVVSAMGSVAKVANQNKIPLFAGDVGSVPRGASVALGFNYYQVGYAAGKKAAKILKGEAKPGDIPSGYAENLSLHLSLVNARKQGLAIADKYIRQAEKVYR
ncbi:MAG: ABC transporter substrate-binding protein [Deltaproteobacteria bacterium]|nr:ABC transporter substrate-binding protein [Deltaproteobacteria bacterium]MBW2072733.1 ABC transporter substrate-binding protein [Deltaproteobacteria bacterium]